jgi:hypothetical protein
MTSTDQDSKTKTGNTKSRREALIKFGRYAAVAPTTMILLGPRESEAGWWGGGWWGGGWGGGDGGKDDDYHKWDGY